MKMGLPYSMESEVIEFEQDRLFAWRTAAPGVFGKVVGGRVWRYEFEPTDDAGTTLVPRDLGHLRRVGDHQAGGTAARLVDPQEHVRHAGPSRRTARQHRFLERSAAPCPASRPTSNPQGPMLHGADSSEDVRR